MQSRKSCQNKPTACFICDTQVGKNTSVSLQNKKAVAGFGFPCTLNPAAFSRSSVSWKET